MTDPKSLLLSLSINELVKSLSWSYMVQPSLSLLLSLLTVDQWVEQKITRKMLVDSEVFRTQGSFLTNKEKIEWTVKLNDPNYFIDKTVEHRQQRFRISHSSQPLYIFNYIKTF